MRALAFCECASYCFCDHMELATVRVNKQLPLLCVSVRRDPSPGVRRPRNALHGLERGPRITSKHRNRWMSLAGRNVSFYEARSET